MDSIAPPAIDSVGGAAIEVDTTADMEIAVDSVSIEAIDAGRGAYLEYPSTPRTKYSLSIPVSCKEHLITVLVLLGLLIIQFSYFYRQQVTHATQIPKNI